MKICTVRIERRLLRYHSPIPTAHGPVGDRWTVLLALEDENGHTGLGEAAPLAGFTPDTVDDAEAALYRWASDDRNGDLPDGSPTARAAVDSALLDLAARVAGTSVHRLLAPDSPDRVAVAALATGATPDDVAASAAEAATSSGVAPVARAATAMRSGLSGARRRWTDVPATRAARSRSAESTAARAVGDPSGRPSLLSSEAQRWRAASASSTVSGVNPASGAASPRPV